MFCLVATQVLFVFPLAMDMFCFQKQVEVEQMGNGPVFLLLLHMDNSCVVH